MNKIPELTFEEQRAKLSHSSQNDSKYLIRLTNDEIETIEYVYEPFLNLISDESNRKEAEDIIKITIAKIIRADTYSKKTRDRTDLPSKEKRDQIQQEVINAIDTVLDSLNTCANQIYDFEKSGIDHEFFEFDLQAADTIDYIRLLKTHQSQIKKLIKGEIQRDEIFHSKDYLKMPQVTKTPLKNLLLHLIQKYELNINSNSLEEILRNTPPIRPVKKSKSTDHLSKTV